LKGKATVVCVYTRARNSSLHKHTLYFFWCVCVCKRAGVICFMMRRVTCYTLSSVARSINRFCILEIGMLMIVWEREKKVAKKRFNFSINDEHCFCFIHIFLFHSFSFSFRSSRQRLFFLFFFFLHSSICSSLNVPISSSSVNNFLQCVSVDGQIGFVYNTDVEPLHVISISKPLITPSTTNNSSNMSNFFHRKTGYLLFKIFVVFYSFILIRWKEKFSKNKRKTIIKRYDWFASSRFYSCISYWSIR
jgi:hypothetical protein